MSAFQGIISAVRRAIIRSLRIAYRLWPFLHGRGRLLRLAQRLLGTGPVRFDIGGGTFIEGPLSDWIIVWTFVREHERDAPFQRSLALLRPGDVAVDVGANVGIWSLLAAKRGASGQAFEPVPALAARLRQHIDENGVRDVVVHEVALGDARQSVPFFAVPDGNTGVSSLARHRDDSVEIRVDVVPLDDVVERADVLKIDVEGAEILVLRGARRLLSSNAAPIIFFEINEQLCARFGATSRDVKELLAEFGYGIYRWNGRAFTSVSLDERHGHEDLFAFKPAHLSTRISS